MKRPKFVELLSLILVGLFFTSLTLLVWPFSDAIIAHAKLFSILFAGITSIALFGLALLQNKKIKFISSPFIAPLILMGSAATISSLLTNAYPVENILGVGGAIVAGVVFALFIAPILPKRIPYVEIMGGTTIILAIFSILQFFGKGPSLWLNQAFGFNIPANLSFNVAGSTLIALQITLVVIAIIIGRIKAKRHIDRLSAVFLPILIIGAGFYIWSLLPGKPAQLILPSVRGSWSIMLDSIRAPRSALIGIGPQNYANAYAQYKPAWLNQGDNWSVIYGQASNAPFSFMTTMGIVGLLAWFLLALRIWKEGRKASRTASPLAWGLITTVILQLLLPPNIVMIGIQFILITLFIALEKQRYGSVEFRTMAVEMVRQVGGVEVPTRSRVQHTSAYLLGGLLIIIAGAGFYLSGRALNAFYIMHQATMSGADNDVIKAYELEQRAITLNPYLDEFRRRYALTNLSIAVALSNNADATEQDKTQTAELIQQATREARAATTLDPNDWQNWSVLAQIYQNLIPVSKDALQWTTQTYVQAANTFPSNPNIRMALGSVFMGQKEYDQAASIFQQAVNLKPDLANSHYNLAVALQNANQLEQAKQEYQSTLSLLESGSDDFVTVTQQLEKLNTELEKLAEQQKKNGQGQTSLTEQNLNQPGANTITDLGGDVNLKQPAAPADTENTPPTTEAPTTNEGGDETPTTN